MKEKLNDIILGKFVENEDEIINQLSIDIELKREFFKLVNKYEDKDTIMSDRMYLLKEAASDYSNVKSTVFKKFIDTILGEENEA